MQAYSRESQQLALPQFLLKYYVLAHRLLLKSLVFFEWAGHVYAALHLESSNPPQQNGYPTESFFSLSVHPITLASNQPCFFSMDFHPKILVIKRTRKAIMSPQVA